MAQDQYRMGPITPDESALLAATSEVMCECNQDSDEKEAQLLREIISRAEAGIEGNPDLGDWRKQ